MEWIWIYGYGRQNNRDWTFDAIRDRILAKKSVRPFFAFGGPMAVFHEVLVSSSAFAKDPGMILLASTPIAKNMNISGTLSTRGQGRSLYSINMPVSFGRSSTLLQGDRTSFVKMHIRDQRGCTDPDNTTSLAPFTA
jgi:hypothetical protein